MSIVDDKDVATLWATKRYYDLRASATDAIRPEGSNVDLITDPETGEKIAICNIVSMLPYTRRRFNSTSIVMHWSFEHHVSVELAVQHLNAGDGSIVPQVAGLNERCPVRFTVEALDTRGRVDEGLGKMMDITRRDPTGPKPLPCAFIGDREPDVTGPTALVSGVLGYPQVSSMDTTAKLDDKSEYKLFGRTIPSDTSNAVPLILFFSQILNIDHLAVVNSNDSFGNDFVNSMIRAAEIHAPHLNIHQVPVSITVDRSSGNRTEIRRQRDEGFDRALDNLERSRHRIIFAVGSDNWFARSVLSLANKRGLAGNGLHNWFFGNPVNPRSLPKDDPLALSLQ